MKFLFPCFVLIAHLSISQLKDWGIEVKPKYGFLIAHRTIMSHIPKEHAKGGEITFFLNASGKKSWHHARNFPKYGLTAYGSSVGNMELLGTQWGLYGFVEFPFSRSEKSEFTGKLGTGLAYGTKIFDQQLNPKNMVLSTHVNGMICLGLQYRYFFKDYHIITGIDLTHMSNGATRMPNLGINLPYFSLGFGKTFNKAKEKYTAETQLELNKWKFTLVGIATFKEIYPSGGKKYPVLASTFFGKRYFSGRSGVEVGADLMYKTSTVDYHENTNNSKNDIGQFGIYSAYVVPLNDLNFIFGMGIYAYDKYMVADRLYHRIGLRYQALDKLLVNFTLKTHWGRADYFEFGLGYTF